MKTTSVFSKNIEAYNKGYRYIVNKGSTRSSKTWSIQQLLYLIGHKSAKRRTISIVSESMPHLKRGCIRDFKQILIEDGLWDEKNWNATDNIYKTNNSIIEFFSVDNPGKVHGPSREILFVNECNNTGWEIIRQLMIRTTETIFLDYNPVEEFWVDTEILGSRKEEALLIHSTYKDNEYLSPQQIREIESNKHDSNWWNIYGLGLTGSREGLCIKNWQQVNQMPALYKKRWLGIDFGFTNDPTAIVDIMLSDGQLWIDEVEYKQGLTNPDIVKIIRDNSLDLLDIVADSAEPKSIQEIKNHGLKIEGANKGPDSVKLGLDLLNRYPINITKRSLNIIREYRNYKYAQDKDGNYLNIPIDKFNHSIDAQRYVALNKLGTAKLIKKPKVKTTKVI